MTATAMPELSANLCISYANIEKSKQSIQDFEELQNKRIQSIKETQDITKNLGYKHIEELHTAMTDVSFPTVKEARDFALKTLTNAVVLLAVPSAESLLYGEEIINRTIAIQAQTNQIKNTLNSHDPKKPVQDSAGELSTRKINAALAIIDAEVKVINEMSINYARIRKCESENKICFPDPKNPSVYDIKGVIRSVPIKFSQETEMFIQDDDVSMNSFDLETTSPEFSDFTLAVNQPASGLFDMDAITAAFEDYLANKKYEDSLMYAKIEDEFTTASNTLKEAVIDASVKLGTSESATVERLKTLIGEYTKLLVDDSQNYIDVQRNVKIAIEQLQTQVATASAAEVGIKALRSSINTAHGEVDTLNSEITTVKDDFNAGFRQILVELSNIKTEQSEEQEQVRLKREPRKRSSTTVKSDASVLLGKKEKKPDTNQ
ncbi:MAG: hypothetical protein MUO31_07710 [Thermodesulfovibrionales bacterium]|nr:hypothetical protein [Thermodesulfovibrionales bacterium]